MGSPSGGRISRTRRQDDLELWTGHTSQTGNCPHEHAQEGNEHMENPLTHPPLLPHKHAVIFGAGGAIGAAVAKEFAAQGATVFLSGRTLSAVGQVAQEIHRDGGVAYAAQVDALDEPAVNAYLESVAHEAGSIDILLNVMGPQPKDYGNG